MQRWSSSALTWLSCLAMAEAHDLPGDTFLPLPRASMYDGQEWVPSSCSVISSTEIPPRIARLINREAASVYTRQPPSEPVVMKVSSISPFSGW
ncbi:MAG: hypothetical protein BWY65_02123 [Firmicutes bacterium ADurb.Bin373]|nr:MAG: hypothetical protein BWY65_02123 [Firmicutes bacterium ADurb.Bin373]